MFFQFVIHVIHCGHNHGVIHGKRHGGSAGYGQNGAKCLCTSGSFGNGWFVTFGSIAHRDQIAVLIKYTNFPDPESARFRRNNQLRNNAVLMCCVQDDAINSMSPHLMHQTGLLTVWCGQRAATVAHGHVSQADRITIWRGCLS